MTEIGYGCPGFVNRHDFGGAKPILKQIKFIVV